MVRVSVVIENLIGNFVFLEWEKWDLVSTFWEDGERVTNSSIFLMHLGRVLKLQKIVWVCVLGVMLDRKRFNYRLMCFFFYVCYKNIFILMWVLCTIRKFIIFCLKTFDTSDSNFFALGFWPKRQKQVKSIKITLSHFPFLLHGRNQSFHE